MSSGELDLALESAQRAVQIDPGIAKTQSVLGFAYLTRFDTRAAKEAFGKAIELDQAEPLARLGLGLAKIREGDLRAGREEIEIAVSLDPGNSLIRSYMGKAYYEEKRDKLAGGQFELAKRYDPRDPTPWFYDAVREQTENRPVEALGDLEKSIELNDNRAVYRSSLLLDEDRAARGANLARIYKDLGFDRLAFLEAARSLSEDQRDPSSHRFLADAYAGLPRHEIARVSELLQSQLRQPISIAPVEPNLSDDKENALKVGVLRGIGVGSPGFNEYTRLFERNGMTLNAEAIGGSHSTVGDQIILSGIRDKISYSVGQAHFETDGLREHAALRRDVNDVFVQASPSSDLSFQAEFRYLDTIRDEVFYGFDPDVTLADTLRERTGNARFGARYSPTLNSDFIFSTIWQERSSDTFAPDIPQPRTLESRAITGEVQYSAILGRFAMVVGGGRLDARNDLVAARLLRNAIHDNVYFYGRFSPAPPLQLHLGVGVDSVVNDELRRRDSRRRDLRRQDVTPKIGLVWAATPFTTVRAASFRSVKRPLIGNQTIEPTQVAGFNQFFDDPNGTLSRRQGVALDHRFGRDVNVGIEFSRRRLEVRAAFGPETFEWRERSHRAYLYWAIPRAHTRALLGSWSAAIGIDPEYELLARDEALTGLEGIRNLRTRMLPLGMRFFHSKGLALSLTLNRVSQRGELRTFPDSNTFDVKDRFSLADFAASYRFPGRQGQMTLGVKNLFDRRFTFVETDPLNPRLASERFVYARLQLTF